MGWFNHHLVLLHGDYWKTPHGRKKRNDPSASILFNTSNPTCRGVALGGLLADVPSRGRCPSVTRKSLRCLREAWSVKRCWRFGGRMGCFCRFPGNLGVSKNNGIPTFGVKIWTLPSWILTCQGHGTIEPCRRYRFSFGHWYGQGVPEKKTLGAAGRFEERSFLDGGQDGSGKLIPQDILFIWWNILEITIRIWWNYDFSSGCFCRHVEI